MKILFLHVWQSVPATYLAQHGHQVINPALPDDDFQQALDIAQAEFDKHQPDVVVGSSRGGALAMNLDSGDVPLVLLCPAWKKFGSVTTTKPGTVILHSRADDVIPFADSEELVKNSGLPDCALIEVGIDHRLADAESLEMMLQACEIGEDDDEEDGQGDLLQQDWAGKCYEAAMIWIRTAEEPDWAVIHGTVVSGKDGKRIDHAWCERGKIVIDLARPIGARIIEREQYYRVVKPEVSRIYSSDDALMLSFKNGHQGPWDESEQLNQSGSTTEEHER